MSTLSPFTQLDYFVLTLFVEFSHIFRTSLQQFSIAELWMFNVIFTYKCIVSLYLGDQLLFLDLVECLLVLSLRWGPTMSISINGRNTPAKVATIEMIKVFLRIGNMASIIFTNNQL